MAPQRHAAVWACAQPFVLVQPSLGSENGWLWVKKAMAVLGLDFWWGVHCQMVRPRCRIDGLKRTAAGLADEPLALWAGLAHVVRCTCARPAIAWRRMMPYQTYIYVAREPEPWPRRMRQGTGAHQRASVGGSLGRSALYGKWAHRFTLPARVLRPVQAGARSASAPGSCQCTFACAGLLTKCRAEVAVLPYDPLGGSMELSWLG